MTDKATADQLAKVLVQLADGGKLKEAANLLERQAKPCNAQEESKKENPRASFSSVSELVQHYKQQQRQDRSSVSNSKAKKPMKPPASKPEMKKFSLNFAQYRRAGRFGYKMVPPGRVQIPGFTDSDSYQDVVAKGAQGLGINNPLHELSLLISSSLVKDDDLPSGKPWTLGNYTAEFGGPQARGKRVFGIFVPFEEDDVDHELQAIPSALSDQKHQVKARSIKEEIDDFKELPEGPMSGKMPIYSSMSDESPTPSPKRPRVSLITNQGSALENPIHIDSADPLEISIDYNNIGVYRPVSNGKVVPGITAVGTIGVWRLLCSDYSTTQEDALTQMSENAWNIQPEKENFILAELIIGNTMYFTMKGVNSSQDEIEIKNAKFYVKEKRLVHSSRMSTLIKSPVPLLVVSDNHGEVDYKWEYKNLYYDKWTDMKVPPYTCLLYADTPRKYRCTVDGESIIFDVKGSCKGSKNIKVDDMAVNYSKIEFKEKIGQGSFGAVYRAIYKDEVVAVKKVKPPLGVNREIIVASSREINALKMLQHPNIVRMIGYCIVEESNELVAIMNMIEGRNLHQLIFGCYLSFSVKLTTEKCVSIAKDIASGLQYMHSRSPKVIHRDIKPLNVMLKDAGQSTMTQKNVMGTYPYMAPEMFTSGQRDTPIDVYSLGCTYIELFGKKKVWPGISSGAEIMQRVCGSFKSPPVMPCTDHLPAQHQEICHACCQLEPKNRPTIDSVINMLKEF